jgi:hypothetical protein
MGEFEGGLYSGTLYGDFFVAGKWTGLKEVGNATKFELKANAEKKELVSKQKGTYGQALKTATMPKPSELKITINDPVREVLTAGFLGEQENIAVAAGSVTSELKTAAQPGNAIDLAYRAISAVTVARVNGEDAATWAATTAKALGDYVVPTTANQHFYKCTAAGTTAASAPTWPTDGSTVTDGTVTWQDMGPIEAVLNTDYSIGVSGAQLGWLTMVQETRIEFGEPLSIDYSYAARAGYRIKGATQPVCKVRWFLDGENFVDGSPVLIEVFETQAMPASPIDFLADDWQSIEIDATPITPTGKDHPYVIEKPKV